MFAGEIRRQRVNQMRCYSNWRWHLDEVFVKVNGERHYLWRAVDHEGEVLESYVTKRRGRTAALKFLKKAMRRYGPPEAIVTDKLRSYRKRVAAWAKAQQAILANHPDHDEAIAFDALAQLTLAPRGPEAVPALTKAGAAMDALRAAAPKHPAGYPKISTGLAGIADLLGVLEHSKLALNVAFVVRHEYFLHPKSGNLQEVSWESVHIYRTRRFALSLDHFL